MRHTLSLCLVLALAACDDSTSHGGGAADAAKPPAGDATQGTNDATPPDGSVRDSAPADAAPADAVVADAATDAAPAADAFPLDAGRLCIPDQMGCLDAYDRALCNETGTAYGPGERCPEGGACRAGECVSACLVNGKDPTYIGCEYWSVDLDNYPDPFTHANESPHAVVVANPSAFPATVTITTGSNIRLPNPQFQVPPGAVTVYTFPRADLDGSGISDRTFRLQSDWPIAAWQSNPLDNVNVASNDASLLLPAESLGRRYVVLSWPTAALGAIGVAAQHGYFTVVATRPGQTQVTVTASAKVEAGGDVPAMMPGESHPFVLSQGQALTIEGDGTDLFGSPDLTGSRVEASQPVAVFGGHEEAVIGNGCCADHLEEQLFPVETWGERYLAPHSEPRGGSQDTWRIVAAEDGTRVSTVPPQPGADGVVLASGQWIEVVTDQSFEVVGDKPVLVGQYLASQEATEAFIGDPSFILAVPVVQFRDDYTVLTPANFDQDWLTVTRKAGTAVALDDMPVPDADFVPFGIGDYEYAYVSVDDGPHHLHGEQPFGLTAYGYSAAVSYGYPGGLDLRTR